MALHADILALAAPIDAPIIIVKGDGRTFLRTLRKRNSDGTYTPYDITTYVFRLQVRTAWNAASVLIAPTLAIVDGPNGVYSETWDPAATAALVLADPTADQGPLGVYDLDVTSAGVTVTLKRGTATLYSEASRT